LDEEAEQGSSPARPWVARTLRYFRPYLADVVLSGLLLLVTSALAVAGPLVLRHALDTDVANKDLAGLARTAGLYVLILLGLVAASWVQRFSLTRVGQGAMATLRAELLRRIVTLKIATFDERPSGKLIASVCGDVDALRQLLTSTFLMLVGDVVLFVAMAGTMLWIDAPLALVALGILPFIALGFRFFQRNAGPRFAAARARNAELTAFLAEHLRAMPVLQALDRTEWARARCRELGERRYAADTHAERVVISFFNGITMTEALGTAAILLVGGARVAEHTLTIGTLVLFFEYVRRYYEPVHRLTEELHSLERARAGAARVYALLDEEPEPDLLLPAEPRRAEKTGELRFEDVWFAYRGSTPHPNPPPQAGEGDISLPWVLKGVSFTVPAGARYALVGPTGHGKSTLLSLLLRFHVAQRGRVLVDGTDVRAIPLAELRARFGLVLQDVRLFPGTLAENVALGLAPPEEHARAALEAISALDLLERLPDGLATVLGDGGAGLSEGERQLVACARALARQPSLLLLDEATSSIDPATEARIQRALESVACGRTVLTVAHRLATVRAADRILYVEKGEIQEQGTREELLRLGGKYAALERLQELERPSADAVPDLQSVAAPPRVSSRSDQLAVARD
jgi:ATP-binding cassette subfamily B protein